MMGQYSTSRWNTRVSSSAPAKLSDTTDGARPPGRSRLIARTRAALGAERLVILTNVEGLYTNWPDKGSLVSQIAANELREVVPGLDAGMILPPS